MMPASGAKPATKEGSIMVLRLCAVACIAFAAFFMGGNGIARAGDADDSYSHPQSDDSYAKPDTAEEPSPPDDSAAPPQEDDSAAPPDDSGGDNANAPPQQDEPE